MQQINNKDDNRKITIMMVFIC